MGSEVVYIHYGDDEFRTPKPVQNKECPFTKPYGGFWASRKDDPEGWKAWCENEEFLLDTFNRHFLFKLKDGARVLELNHKDQLDSLPKMYLWTKYNDWSECALDFEKLAQDYDAIEVTDIGQLYWPLYGWDCNSILIMNPDIVEVIEEKEDNI